MFVRYAVLHEYEGTPYHGWQAQESLPTVQGALTQALHQFLPQASALQVAGRTDAGVHALGQMSHFDLPNGESMEPFKIQQAWNAHLRDHAISILDVRSVPLSFHARFSAQARSYRYCICNRRAPLTITKERAWHVITPLDVDLMQKAAHCLKGTHDFSTFRASDCQASSAIRTLDDFVIERNQCMITFHVQARSFLHHQVRNMVGALKNVGEGRWSIQDFQNAIDAKNRHQNFVMAPAHGLYLVSVSY